MPDKNQFIGKGLWASHRFSVGVNDLVVDDVHEGIGWERLAWTEEIDPHGAILGAEVTHPGLFFLPLAGVETELAGRHVELERAARAGAPAVLLWESEPVQPAAELAQRASGAPNVVFSPAEVLAPEDRAAGVDYIAIQNANLDRLAAALTED